MLQFCSLCIGMYTEFKTHAYRKDWSTQHFFINIRIVLRVCAFFMSFLPKEAAYSPKIHIFDIYWIYIYNVYAKLNNNGHSLFRWRTNFCNQKHKNKLDVAIQIQWLLEFGFVYMNVNLLFFFDKFENVLAFYIAIGQNYAWPQCVILLRFNVCIVKTVCDGWE